MFGPCALDAPAPSLVEAATLGDSRHIAGSVQHTHDHDLVRPGLVVDRISPVKGNAQPGGELIACRGSEREVPHRLEGSLDGPDEPRRYML